MLSKFAKTTKNAAERCTLPAAQRAWRQPPGKYFMVHLGFIAHEWLALQIPQDQVPVTRLLGSVDEPAVSGGYLISNMRRVSKSHVLSSSLY